MNDGLLAGVRVLDLSRLIPGAIATRRLADFGADVVKVEEPGRGDYLRTIPPLLDGDGLMHLILNRGKRSVALDLKTDEGRAGVLRLIATADVVVEVSRPGRFAELGVDFAELRRGRPELVVCSVTGFGQTGPLAQVPSHGMNMDALAGSLKVERAPDGTLRLPDGPTLSLASELGGTNAALAVAAALYRVRVTGEGCWIDASCWDSGVDVFRVGLALMQAGLSMPEVGDLGPLYSVYETADRRAVMFCAIERKFWENFCQGVGRSELSGRWDGVDIDFGGDLSLRKELEEIFIGATAQEWTERFSAWDVPATEILDLAGVLDHPHTTERGLIADGLLGTTGPLRMMETGKRPGAGLRPAPVLGQDTDDVFREWSAPAPTTSGA